jgi:phosphoribosylanthranilate isomerase
MTDVKICGLTNRDDALAALDLGADYLGFVVCERSPRHVGPTALRRLLEKESALHHAVGVFVNRPRAEVEQLVADCGLVAAQLHGDEEVEAFAGSAAPLWRAVKFADGLWLPDPDAWTVERLVVDAAVPGAYGGTGTVADWDAAAELAGRRAVMLSGGLTPRNVATAVRQVRPRGVDVSSGVEASPGRKDRAAVAAFIRAARAADADY